MKVQLVVVRGKPEGKVIPLTVPKFKIGRGETCNLRPISEQISREHAEFELQGNTLTVRDLGSRNGTLVNGKALTSGPCTLRDRDLVQVGPLTFAVAIQEAKPAAPPAAKAAPEPSKPAKAVSPDDISTEDIDSWLLGERSGDIDQATAVYGGDTITIAAFKDAQVPAPPAKPAATPPPNRPPSVADDSEYERQTEDEEEENEDEEKQEDEDLAASAAEDEEETEDQAEESGPEEEFMDPSNPFYAAKKAQKDQEKAKPAAGGQAGASNQTFRDSSDAANEILRKLMERRRASKS